MKQIFSLQKGMTQAISHFSRYPDAKITRKKDGKFSYEEGKRTKTSALNKIKWFYRVMMFALFLLAVVLFLAGNFSPPEKAADLKSKTEKSVGLKPATEKSVELKPATGRMVDPKPPTEKAGTSAK